MVRGLLFSVIFLSTFSSAFAQSISRSAKRDPNTSYLVYKNQPGVFSAEPIAGMETPGDVAVKYSPGAVRAVTEWKSIAEMNHNFQEFRDKRFLKSDSQPGLMRRSSWLYPDDGCFARAALAVLNLSHAKVSTPDKIFVFGNLSVKTQNSPYGSVSWWYHVAPIVQVQGEKYVLDPAINPRAPLILEEWLARMNPDIKDLEVAICQSGSYTPDDPCNRLTDGVEERALDEQIPFLGLEWSRLEELKRNPSEELGDRPPWLDAKFVF